MERVILVELFRSRGFRAFRLCCSAGRLFSSADIGSKILRFLGFHFDAVRSINHKHTYLLQGCKASVVVLRTFAQHLLGYS